VKLGRFCQLPYVLNHELADDLDQGRRRPEWMWMALRGYHCGSPASCQRAPGPDALMPGGA